MEDVSVAHDAWGQHHNDDDDEGTRWKGKGKAIAHVTNDVSSPAETPTEAFTVDWTKYEPPEGLKYVGDIDSEVIMQIIQQSIDRVRARIAEEEESRKAAAEVEERRQEEAEAASEKNVGLEGVASKGKGVEGVQDEGTNEINGADWPLKSVEDVLAADDAPKLVPIELTRRPGRGLLKFFRMFNNGLENGESSAAGAARLEGGFKTHAAKRSLVSELINKVKEPEAPDVECVSCLEVFPPTTTTVRTPCHHDYCAPCFSRLIASACRNEQHWPPKCCLTAIPATTIRRNVDDAQWAEYAARALEWDLPVAERIYCSMPECSLFIRPAYIIRAQGVARCGEGHYTCLICRNPQHLGNGNDGNGVCPQDKDILRTNELAEASGWKRCPRCHALVEHSDGCQHMTCRCGAEFCYVCGATWQTCHCTMTHLALFKQAAEARRQERVEQEKREEEETLEALRLVRAFEEEEERQVEMQREKERRLAEERWRKRYMEIEVERQATAARFEELRGCMGSVNEMQRVEVQRYQEKRERQLRTKADAVRCRMRDVHALERETGHQKVAERIAQREGEIKAEYVARAVEERQIEEEYAAKLRDFWGRKGKDGGEKQVEVEAAMVELRMRMDAWFEDWKRCTDNDLAAYRHGLREEQGIREEIMEEKERRLESRAREVFLEVAKRKTAELRWVREVFEERGRLLDELEHSAMEELGDVGDEFPEDPLEQEAWIALQE